MKISDPILTGFALVSLVVGFPSSTASGVSGALAGLFPTSGSNGGPVKGMSPPPGEGGGDGGNVYAWPRRQWGTKSAGVDSAVNGGAESPSTETNSDGNATTTSQPAGGQAGEDASTLQTDTAGASAPYMDVVSTWRNKMNLPPLEHDSTLESNAHDTSASSGGQLVHKLNPGSMAQVMAPGDAGNFESVFVGGWLCEIPSLPGLGSAVCDQMSQGWDHAGQTGHAEILSGTTFSKIGCGQDSTMWTCDLA